MKTTVIEVPVELKPAIEKLVTVCERALGRAEQNRRLDALGLEAELREAARECEGAALGAVLRAADVDAPRIRVEGKVLFRVGRFETTYFSAAGPLAVTRTLYREVRNGPTFDPIAMKLGLVGERWLPGAASQMGYLLSQGTSREAEETARQLGRLPFSRSSFERVGHQIGELYVSRHAEIDQELIETFDLPDGAAGLVVSLDRVSVPMEEPIPGAPRRRKRQRRTATNSARTRPRRAKRKAERRVVRNFRMAYCGTITIVDEVGDALHTIRYGRMPRETALDLAEGLASDVFALRAHARDRGRELAVTLVQDGAPELWNLLDGQLNAKTLGAKPYRLIDLFHVLEKLGEAAKSLHGEEASKAVLRQWKVRLLNAKTASAMILAELHRAGSTAAGVHEAITYLENNSDRMDYATARREGRPVGSGNVEATCKSLVALRMKRSGSRWKEETGEHVIQLRALALSHRWDAAIRLTLRPLQRTVRRAA